MNKPWHERDDVWEGVMPALFSRERWQEAPAEVERLIALAGLQPGMHILDLGCGVGRHSLELARRGFRVTALDRTQAYLHQAATLARAENLHVEFVCDDMRHFVRPHAFDAVINLFTSFGYFEDPADDRRVAAGVWQSLKKGGIFILDLMGKEVLARIFRERDWHREGDLLVLEERKLGPCWDRIESCWVIFRGNQRSEYRLAIRLYSAVELIALLRDVGFTDVTVYGDLSGRPYDHTARQLIAIAHKG